jgi:hypothetical protein
MTGTRNVFFLFLALGSFICTNAIAGSDEKNPSNEKQNAAKSPEKVKWIYLDTTSIMTSGGNYLLNKNSLSPMVNPNEKPQWMLALATNPLSLFLFKQIAISLDIIRPKKSHEFRYNYIKDATKLLWVTEEDGYSPPSIIYSGYQLSYTLKFVHQKPFDTYKYIYQGPQIRYTSREYEDIVLNMVNKATKDSLRSQVITSGSKVYDLVFVTGQQVRWKLLFVDLYAGAGIGYKTLTTNRKDLNDYDLYKESGFDSKDTRFKSTRWNRIYVPTRAGIRVGILF